MGNGLIRELLGINGRDKEREAQMQQLEMQIKQAQLQKLLTPEPMAQPDPYKQMQTEKLAREMAEQDRRAMALQQLSGGQGQSALAQYGAGQSATGLSPDQMQALAVIDPKGYADKLGEQKQKATSGEQMYSSLQALRDAYAALQKSGGAVTSSPDGLGGYLRNFSNSAVASDNPISGFLSKNLTPADNEQRFKIRAMAGGMLPLMMSAQGGSSKMFDTAAEREGFLRQLGDPAQPIEANLYLLDKLQKDLVEKSGFTPPEQRQAPTPEQAREILRQRRMMRQRQ